MTTIELNEVPVPPVPPDPLPEIPPAPVPPDPLPPVPPGPRPEPPPTPPDPTPRPPGPPPVPDPPVVQPDPPVPHIEDNAPSSYIEALAQVSIGLQRQTLLVQQSMLKVLEQMNAKQAKQKRGK